jgi:hypothetical protein
VTNTKLLAHKYAGTAMTAFGLATFLFVLSVVMRAVPGFFAISLMALAFVWYLAIPAIVALAGFGVWLMIKMYGRGAVVLAPTLLIFICTVAFPYPSQSVSAKVAYWAQFLVYKARLDGEAADAARRGPPTSLSYIEVDGWNAFGSGFMVDSGGEILRPFYERSPAWKAAARNSPFDEDEGCSVEVSHLYSDYYHWSSVC